jgi:hypothetical protein
MLSIAPVHIACTDCQESQGPRHAVARFKSCADRPALIDLALLLPNSTQSLVALCGGQVITEGVLLRRLASEPDLPGVGAVLLDEFHERNLDADLALALLRDVQVGGGWWAAWTAWWSW